MVNWLYAKLENHHEYHAKSPITCFGVLLVHFGVDA